MRDSREDLALISQGTYGRARSRSTTAAVTRQPERDDVREVGLETQGLTQREWSPQGSGTSASRRSAQAWDSKRKEADGHRQQQAKKNTNSKPEEHSQQQARRAQPTAGKKSTTNCRGTHDTEEDRRNLHDVETVWTGWTV